VRCIKIPVDFDVIIYGRLQVAEEFVWQVCHQMALALSECHSRSRNGNAVLHRDLKPANIFLDARHNVKIGDFGLARVLNPSTQFTKTCVGTPYYMSPVSSPRLYWHSMLHVTGKFTETCVGTPYYMSPVSSPRRCICNCI